MKENIRYVVDVSIPDPFPGKKRNIKRRGRSAPRKVDRTVIVTDRADIRWEMIDTCFYKCYLHATRKDGASDSQLAGSD